MPDLFPGQHAVYLAGGLTPYRLPDGFDDEALWPALVVDGAVILWDSVTVGPAFSFRTLDDEVRVFRETERYTLISNTWRSSDAPVSMVLEILRGSSNPFRLEQVFHGEWSVELPPDEQRPFVLHPDGTVERVGDRVCAYSEAASTYECRAAR